MVGMPYGWCSPLSPSPLLRFCCLSFCKIARVTRSAMACQKWRCRVRQCEDRPKQTKMTSAGEASLLIVGAGGIGCELIKNLVLAGMKNLHVVDLDSIDVSNLNRQFLFKRCHVGMSKAEVACEAGKALRPDVSITAHHANIKEAKFGPEFFRKFDVVLNALDNREARRHVNRLCLMTDRPLIEAGSTGFNGQVMPIVGRATECYECHPPPREKSFPICTIRSTPDKPEHCIAWAKYLFEAIFGPDDETNVLSDMKSEFQAIVDAGSLGVKSAATVPNPASYAKTLFEHLFVKQVCEAIEAGGTWDSANCPRAFTLDSDDACSDTASAISEVGDSLLRQRRIWSLKECYDCFKDTYVRIHDQRQSEIGALVFNKDDADALDFVAAASNVRMFNFRIPRKSRWDIQSIAGAIIPAIASTNSIVAALQTAQLLHFLTALHRSGLLLFQEEGSGITRPAASDILKSSAARFVWVKQFALGRQVLLPEPMSPPNRLCFVCQQQRIAVTMKSIAGWTLRSFADAVVKKELGCSEPLIESGSERKCIYDPDLREDDPDEFDKQVGMSLEEWGIVKDSALFVTDFSQDFQCDVIIAVDESLSEEAHPAGFKVNVEKIQEGADIGKKRRVSEIEAEESALPVKRAK
eukprot:Polyplicarium_translucidae@DN2813_c0_g1_i1.p1